MSDVPRRWGWTANAAAQQTPVQVGQLVFDRVVIDEDGGKRQRSLDVETFVGLPLDERIRLHFERKLHFFKDGKPVKTVDALKSLMQAARPTADG